MTFFRRAALAVLGLAVAPVARAADTCELALAGLEVQVERRDAELELAVQDGGLLRSRLILPADGPLRGCWVLDADGDAQPEAVVATAVTEPGQPARLRAFRWAGDRLEPASLPPLTVTPAFADSPREQLSEADGVLFRSLKLGARELRYRFVKEPAAWRAVDASERPPAHNPANSLLQAPIER